MKVNVKDMKICKIIVTFSGLEKSYRTISSSPVGGCPTTDPHSLAKREQSIMPCSHLDNEWGSDVVDQLLGDQLSGSPVRPYTSVCQVQLGGHKNLNINASKFEFFAYCARTTSRTTYVIPFSSNCPDGIGRQEIDVCRARNACDEWSKFKVKIRADNDIPEWKVFFLSIV